MQGSNEKAAATPLAPKADNIIQTAIEAGRRQALEVRASPLKNGIPYVILRNADGSERVELVTDAFVRPDRKTGAAKLNDVDSLIEYWARHAINNKSSLYGTMSPAQFVAIINDHAFGDDSDAPDFRDHRATFTLGHSNEWKEWSGRNKQKFESGVHFAEWLEDHIPDMVSPDGATMLEIALNFRVTSNAAYSAATRLADGKTQFAFNNAVEGGSQVRGGTVDIPDLFVISIPVFEGIDARKYSIEARFRYRLHGSALSIWYELVRPHKVVEQAFKDILNRIEQATKTKVLFGTPD